MGAGASVEAVDKDFSATYAEEAIKEIGLPEGTEQDIIDKITKDFKLVAETISAGINGEVKKCQTGLHGIKMKDCTGEADALKKAVWKFKVAAFLKAASLLGKHMEKIHALYQALGPVEVPGKVSQITRKAIMEKLKAEGKLPEAHHKAFAHQLMTNVGQEKVQGCPEEDYHKILEWAVEKEGVDGASYDRATYAIKGECPMAKKIQAEMDKLDSKGEKGISEAEFRYYFFGVFLDHGEDATLGQIAMWNGFIGGTVPESEFKIEEAEPEE